MKEEYVNEEITRKLIDKGCPVRLVIKADEHSPILYELPKEHPDWQDCKAWYIPTISKVLRWLREEKKLFVEVIAAAYGYIYIISDTPDKGGTDREYSLYRGSNDACAWDDYNDCVLDAINNILDNLI